LDIFMVFQNKHFKLEENIYIVSIIEKEESSDEKNKTNSKVDKITLQIYSYTYSLFQLKNKIDKITEKYINSIKENRANNRFIYFLEKVSNSDDENKYDCWKEHLFETSKSFNNTFFDGKKQIIEKIDFFINNREWYYEKGIPYSLGIGLSGPAGTGKTSFIKALAERTNRHIVSISLKLIKTKQQLEQFFFETTYSEYNEKGSISFNNKIIVFEDIDCIGDLVFNRDNKKTNIESSMDIANLLKNKETEDILKIINEIKNGKEDSECLVSPNITLDDILNLWDGIRETPGRIIIVTSNKYEQLDPALIRPGRIDISHKLTKASHQTIKEIYKHLFNLEIDDTLQKIKEYYYSPAELINIYIKHKNPVKFIEELIKVDIVPLEACH